MAHGRTARKRRIARRATQRATQGVDNAQLSARAQARAAKPVLSLVPEAPSVLSTLDARRAAREFAASGSSSLPLGDRAATWDSAAADKAVRTWAGVTDTPNAKYASAFLWKDSAGGDKFGDYKLPFAEPVDGTLTANWAAITSAAGALQGARGGVQIPDADKAAIKTKLEGYYSKAATQYKDKGIKVPWADDKAEGETEAFLLAYAVLGPDVEPAVLAVSKLLWEEAFAMGSCANCDHAYSVHLGTAGPCTNGDCDCNGYEDPSADEDGQDGDGDASYKPTEDLMLALRVVEAAGPAAAEFVRVQLTGFALAPTDDDVSKTLPDAHKPGSRLPRKNPGAKATPPPAAADVVPGSLEWSAIFAPEGKLTSDGRAFAPGAITWRELPLTLMAMTETSEGGHIGAEVAGRIDKIWRDEAAGLIRASGVFADTEYGSLIACAAIGLEKQHSSDCSVHNEPALQAGPCDCVGALTASLVGDQTLRGVSVDLAISDYDVGPKSDWFDEDGNWDPKPQAEDDTPDLLKLYGEDTIAVILAAEIGMTTVCPFPAFAEAKIAMGESLVAGANPAFWTVTGEAGWTIVRKPLSGDLTASANGFSLTADGECVDCEESLTAAAAGLVPVAPPAEWFLDPELEELTPLTITDEGQIFGHAFDWTTCHIGLPGQCRTAPHSMTGYELFHLGEIVCEDGSRVSCGQITLDTGHAGREMTSTAAIRHYDDTGTVVAHVVMGEDEHGGWVAGAIMPDAPASKVRLLRGSKLSGDWRKKDGHLELCALLAVNVPGFPVPRATARLTASAAGDGEMEVTSLVAAGITIYEADLTAEEWEQFKAIQAHAQFIELARQA